MQEYNKIQSIYKRDEKTGKFIIGQYSLPCIEYLKDNIWSFTEKIDGTNIRVDWDGKRVEFGGRTNNAQIPTFLLSRLQELFPVEKFQVLYPEQPILLFGEGYGARIQKGGGNYIPNGVDFILFDVMVAEWTLQRQDVEDVANKMGIKVVPVIGCGTLYNAIDKCMAGFTSTFGNFIAEGIVLRPTVELKDRSGHRVITKVKCRDFTK